MTPTVALLLSDDDLNYDKLSVYLDSILPPRDFLPAEWLRTVADLAAIFKAELPRLSQEDRRRIEGMVLHHLIALLTRLWPGGNIGVTSLEDTLLPITRLIAEQSDEYVLYFCWLLVRYAANHSWTKALAPVRWLSKWQRLPAAFSFEALQLAATLAVDADKMFWWPEARGRLAQWSRDSQVYISCLEQESNIVRAWAAKALGVLYARCLEHGLSVPPVADVMVWLRSLEEHRAGVCGAFLDGSGWGLSGELTDHANGFDFRQWMLDTLLISSSEPRLPEIQTLEFHAHEFFDGDADAIRQFLAMGRRHLALMTATETPERIDLIRDVLDEMVNSDDPEIADTIRTYLSERESHAGM